MIHETDSRSACRTIMFAFLGSRGALCRFALDLARVTSQREGMKSAYLISTANELFGQYGFLGDNLLPVDTFGSKFGALTNWHNMVALRQRVSGWLRAERADAFVTLLSHVWSPLLAPVVRRAGVPHTVIVHDAVAHPGDHNSLIVKWLLQEARAADRVVTLSDFVAGQLVRHGVAERKVSVLFHPDFDYGPSPAQPSGAGGPLRVLFLGRILPYKGLGLLVDAVEALTGQGLPVKLGVFGAGRIDVMDRLGALGAEVENRWLDDGEFGPLLARYDLVALSHTEASQSGIVAAALGAGVPVLVTPVGGLVEQVVPDLTGIVADAVSADALAAAIRRFAENPDLVRQLRAGIASTREQRSMGRFFERLSAVALGN